MDNPITEGAASAAASVASHPKVSMAVAATLSAAGTASILATIQTAMGLISVGIGIAIGWYVLKNNKIKNEIYTRMRDNGESLKE